jgi:hypothetical protein
MSGLRVDVARSDPETGAERWVDVSTVHTTSQSYLKAEYEDVKRRVAAAELAVEPACNPALLDPSPAVAAREKLKRDKYAILVAIAAKQTAEYKRSATPAIAPFVLSDNGEMGPSANELQEWLVDAYRRRQQGPALDGVSVSQRVLDFRRRLRLQVMTALAAGVGSMTCAAGRPWFRSHDELSLHDELAAMARAAELRREARPDVPVGSVSPASVLSLSPGFSPVNDHC